MKPIPLPLYFTSLVWIFTSQLWTSLFETIYIICCRKLFISLTKIWISIKMLFILGIKSTFAQCLLVAQNRDVIILRIREKSKYRRWHFNLFFLFSPLHRNQQVRFGHIACTCNVDPDNKQTIIARTVNYSCTQIRWTLGELNTKIT